jgi:hypothetical protein
LGVLIISKYLLILNHFFFFSIGVRGIAESLERAERVRHVYVHAGGKIEALGTGTWAAPRGSNGSEVAPQVTVETVCVVDIRQNNPNSHDAAGLPIDDTMGGASSSNPALSNNSLGPSGGSQIQDRRHEDHHRQGGGGDDNNWAEPRTKKTMKKKKKRIAVNPKREKPMTVAQQKKRERQRVKDEKEKQRNARIEKGWSGRGGGMEQTGRTKTVREVGSNSTLPPLHQNQLAATAPQLGGSMGSGGSIMDGSSTMPSDVSGHIQRANAAAEAILAPNGGGGGGGKRRTGKKSQGAFSKQLQNSPLMQPAGFGAAGKKRHT